MGADDRAAHESAFIRFCRLCIDFFEKPVIWFRENVVEPNRQEYYWYHEKIRRVPTVDECYTDDAVCIYEAEEQYRRDRIVDEYIVNILKKKHTYCSLENPYETKKCDVFLEQYHTAAKNYFIKYGDMGIKSSALNCLIKQKNRMAWERRHGPVGSGKKEHKEDHSKNKPKDSCS